MSQKAHKKDIFSLIDFLLSEAPNDKEILKEAVRSTVQEAQAGAYSEGFACGEAAADGLTAHAVNEAVAAELRELLHIIKVSKKSDAPIHIPIEQYIKGKLELLTPESPEQR